MSYRNPQIIVDRSAEIYAGMATAGANAFNAYMKAREQAQEKAKKEDEGLLKALSKTKENINKKIDEGVDLSGGINSVGGMVKKYKKIYQEKADPLVSAVTKMNMGLTSVEETKLIREQETENDSWSARTIDSFGAYGAQAKTYGELSPGEFNSKYVIAGDTPKEKLANKTFLDLTSDIPLLDGIEAGLDFGENENIIQAKGRIKVGSEAYDSYIEAGLISEKDIEDGYINFEWKADTRNKPRDLYVDKIQQFDLVKSLEENNLIKDGVVKENFFTNDEPVYSKPIDVGNGKQYYQTVKRYVDTDKIFQGAFGDQVDAFAESVTSSDTPLSAQLDFVKSMGGNELLEQYKKGSDRVGIITTDLETQAITYLTDSQGIGQDENGFYVLSRTKPQNYKRQTATEQRDAKALEKSKSSFLRAKKLIEQEGKLPSVPANPFNPTGIITDEGKRFRAAIAPIIADSGGKLVSFVVSEVTGEPSVKVKYPGVEEKEITLANFRDPDLLTARFEEATGAGTGLIDKYFDINLD